MIPTKEQAIDSISNTGNIIAKPLQGYTCVLSKRNGLPLYYLGGFGMAFKMESGDACKAVKVWLKDISDNKERMQLVSEFLKDHPLPYFVGYEFCEQSLRIDDGYTDVMIMDWVDGLDLKKYIESVYESGLGEALVVEKLHTLEVLFRECFAQLHKNNISHGDLQHANIIVSESTDGDIKIKLIDYDSMYVPALSGRPQVTSGYSGYQHPQRISGAIPLCCSEKDDYFSEKIIIASLQLLQAKPYLWDDEEVDSLSNEEGLLFRDSDFESFKNCYLFKQGNETPAREILEEIANDLIKDVRDIQPLGESGVFGRSTTDIDIERWRLLMRLLFQLEDSKKKNLLERCKDLKNRIVELSNQFDSEKKREVTEKMNKILESRINSDIFHTR